MIFLLPLFTDLSKSLCLDIIDDDILNKTKMTDPDNDNSFSFSGASTYRGDELELILGYIDKDVMVQSAWLKI